MRRRGFLGALAAAVAAPFVANAVEVPVQPQTPEFVPFPTPGERQYLYIQAKDDLIAGMPVYLDGRLAGFAAGDISKGHYGWACIQGPFTTVKG
jgi:hypothetical protein